VVDNAVALADGLTGLGARLVTGGTDNHLVLLDVSPYDITGRQAEGALIEAGIVVNRNAIPRDPQGPWFTSGVRLGTPALTTRGFEPDDLREVAAMIDLVLRNTKPTLTAAGAVSKVKYTLDSGVRQDVLARAAALVAEHPLYPGLQLA
jgi:glycine hydroxymethyltransferase